MAESRLLRDGLPAGSVAPLFDLPSVSGGRLRLAEYAGRRVLIVFSDPHCGPCATLAPRLEELQAVPGAPQVLVISRGDRSENRDKAKELGLTYPIGVQDAWHTSREYGIFATPAAFLVGPDGRTEQPVAVGPSSVLALATGLAVTASSACDCEAPRISRRAAVRRLLASAAGAVAAVAAGVRVLDARAEQAIPLDLSGSWKLVDNLNNICSPDNPTEASFNSGKSSATFNAASSNCQCCACIARIKEISLGRPVTAADAHLKGAFHATRTGTYALASLRVELFNGGKPAGSRFYTTEHRPNNNCTVPGTEILIPDGVEFDIPLTFGPSQFDGISIGLTGYGCCDAATSATVANVRIAVPGTAPAPDAAKSSGPSVLPWLVAGGLGALVVGGIVWLLRRSKPEEPQVPKVPPVTPPKVPPTVERQPCGCSCSVTITGPLDLKVCSCDDLTFDFEGGGGTRGILRATRKDGSIAFKRAYVANITPQCGGAAEWTDKSAQWTISRAGDTLAIGCTGTLTYNCPDGAHACSCTAEPRKIKLLEAPCVIEVITLDLHFAELIGHVAIKLSCGETTELWGYFPKDRASLTAPFQGTPGSVDHRSSSELLDTIGKDYSGYYCTNGKKTWAIAATCAQCEKIRRYWEALAANPGTYVLASSNCATHAIDSLRAAGVNVWFPLEDDDEGLSAEDAYRPGLVDDFMNQMAGDGRCSPQTDIPPNPNCQSEH